MAHGNWMFKATQPLQRADDTLIIIGGGYIPRLMFHAIWRVAHCDAEPGNGEHADVILLIELIAT